MSKVKEGFSTGKGFLKTVDKAIGDKDGNEFSATYYKKTDTVENVKNTDFTNTAWTSVASGEENLPQLVAGATYQIRVNTSSTSNKKEYCYALVYADAGTDQEIPLSTHTSQNASTKIITITYYCAWISSSDLKMKADKTVATTGETPTTTNCIAFEYRRIR